MAPVHTATQFSSIKLVSALALCVVACGDVGSEDGALVPPYSGPLPAAGEAPVATQSPASTVPASNPVASPGGTSSTSEGPRGNLPIATGGNTTTSSGTSGETPGTDEGPDDATNEPVEPARPALDCAAQPAAFTGGGNQACRVNASGGVDDGQSWYMWYSGSNGCMTPRDDGAFRATWNDSGDFLARMGLFFGETNTFEDYGTIGADLAFKKSGSGGNYSFIGVYGWSNEPLVEYYIVEDSYGNGPAVPFATQQRGQFDLDGASYRVYTGTKTNQPSIHGNATFQQVFSVRQSPRQCGHVSISEHFRRWQGMGINLGKMYEARVLVEAGGGSGSIDFTTAYVTTSVDP